MSLVHLDQEGVLITDREASFPGGRWSPGQVQQAWIEARRPGLAAGVLTAALGAMMFSRSAGLGRLLGLVVLALGVLRARSAEHALVLRLRDGGQATALRTRDPALARKALAALDRARGAALPAGEA